MCLKESSFPDCCKVSLVVPVFKNVGEMSTAKNYRHASFLFVVSKTSIRTNLKLYNISVTPKMVKKVIMNLDLSKASGPNCIPVVVLKEL